MTKETVRARAWSLVQGRRGIVVAGRTFGKNDEEIMSLVECPFCWALTMPNMAEAHAERCGTFEERSALWRVSR